MTSLLAPHRFSFLPSSTIFIFSQCENLPLRVLLIFSQCEDLQLLLASISRCLQAEQKKLSWTKYATSLNQ